MKKKIIIVFILISILTLIGFTYAVYTWSVSMNIKGEIDNFDIAYLKGRDIGSNENSKTLIIGRDYYDGLSTTVEVKIKETSSFENGTGTLYLNTDISSSSELLKSNALKYQVIEGNTISSSGIINTTGKMKIASDINITKIAKVITVSVWIDGNNVTNDNYEKILASTYVGSIGLEVESR